MLVVAEKARGRGTGKALVRAAEERIAAAGCELIEVTSNVRLVEAHGFYAGLGYEQTSLRFAKKIRLTTAWEAAVLPCRREG